MRPIMTEFASPEVQRAAQHLARLVREARLARRMPQSELATRARTSKPTLVRIEKGSVESSLGVWLAVLEQLGLLKHITALEDPTTAALAEQQRGRRARRRADADLDF